MTISALILAFASALFYVGATLIMKIWGPTAFAIALPAAGLVLLIAAAIEIEALRNAHMGRIFVVIIGFEIIVTMACAMIVVGEAVTIRDLAGVSLLIAGVVVISVGHDSPKSANLQLSETARQARSGVAPKSDRISMAILRADIAPQFDDMSR